MIVETDRAGGIVTKRAETAAELARLRHEAAVLSEAHHPGVVELIGVDEAAIRLRAVDGRPLDDRGQLTDTEIAALGAELATTLADLHDIGTVHGALTSEHVLLDASGLPVLCSFGWGADAAPTDDVAALGRLLASVRSAESTGSGCLLDRAVGAATRADARRRPTARAVAKMLAAASSDHSHGSTPRRHFVFLTLVSVLLVVVLATMVVRPRRRAGVVLTTAMGQYQLSESGDPLVVGRWTCTAVAFPALLRPRTGEVWIWNSWPTTAAGMAGRLVARVDRATSLRAAGAAAGCETLVINRAGGGPVAINPRTLPSRPN